MNIVEIAQLVGTVSLFILFCINLMVVSSEVRFLRSGRIVIIWLTVYGFFLFVVRLLSFMHLASLDQLRIISGFSSLIPLLMILLHLFVIKKTQNDFNRPNIPKIFVIMISLGLLLTIIVQRAAATPILKNCNNFVSQKEAQQFYIETNQKTLDRDQDGLACEDLP